MSFQLASQPNRSYGNNWVEDFFIRLWDNIMFVLWGGVAGYMLGHFVARLGHALGFYIADSLQTEYALRWQIWVYYGSLWGTALLFAYFGLTFALITKRRPEPEQVEEDLLEKPEEPTGELYEAEPLAVTSSQSSRIAERLFQTPSTRE